MINDIMDTINLTHDSDTDRTEPVLEAADEEDLPTSLTNILT